MFAQLIFLGLFVFNPCFDSWFFCHCLPLKKFPFGGWSLGVGCVGDSYRDCLSSSHLASTPMQCFSLCTFVIWEFYLALFDGNQIRVGFQYLLKRGNARHRLHCREKYPARHVPAHSSSFFTLFLLFLRSRDQPLFAPVQESSHWTRGLTKRGVLGLV